MGLAVSATKNPISTSFLLIYKKASSPNTEPFVCPILLVDNLVDTVSLM